MIRSSLPALLSLSVLLSTACAPAETRDAEGDQGSAQTASVQGDLLATCPALEGVELVAPVVGEADVLVKQEYTLASFGAGGQLLPGRRVTTAQTPSTNYTLRFYRDAQGRAKFRLGVGTWSGMEASIDGSVKRATISGTVTPGGQGADPTSGVLKVTSRRDNFETLAGSVSDLSFEGLDCQGGRAISVGLPILTLDKTSDDLVDVQDGAGRTLRVTPKVRWQKKAASATLQFHAVEG